MLTRRGFVAGGACSCVLAGAAQARVIPASLQPLVGAGYRPGDADEKGLWQDCDRLEFALSRSNLLLQSPEMHDYTMKVVGRLLGDQAREVRAYIVHDPEFNASMAPNGMLLVNTGLLVRIRNEAQYAAVLGHESGHYLRRHSVASWRNHKTRTGIMAFVGAGSNVMAGATAMAGGDGRGWIDLAGSINQSMLLSIFSFDRGQESEADAYGLRLIEQAGYPPEAAAEMWQQYSEERKASAAARSKRYRDNARSAYSTHPANAERMLDLNTSAREIVAANRPGVRYDDRREAWREVIAPLRPMLLDEQVKLNDPGASLYLIDALARDGWDGTLRFYQGEAYRLRDEPGDADRAATAYAAAVGLADAPAEAWRAQGYALLKAGNTADGHAALARYLTMKPAAGDAAMVRFSMGG